jgi:uncharacterized membrane protein YdbT with pleckstrin-like domain
MGNKKRSIMSKGWLIIGLVMLITGSGLIFLANSLLYESNQIQEYIINEENNENIEEVANHISINARFLVIASLIIIIVGIIMCVEWISFSKFLNEYMKK